MTVPTSEYESPEGAPSASSGPQPFFRYYGPPHPLADILLACGRGRLRGDGTARERLEKALAELLGADNAICLPQARLGIYLALSQVLTPRKPKVILSPYTIYDVVNVVIAAGGIPVFADVDETTCNIDFDSAANLVDDRTGAVLVTHLHGLACEMSAFVSLCRSRNIPLIEDCAQAFGAIYDHRRVGTIGDAGIFSFSTKKHVNGLYGGCMTLKDSEAGNACRSFLASLAPERSLKLIKRAVLSSAGNIANSRLLFSSLTFPALRFLVARRGEFALPQVTLEHASSLRKELPTPYLRQMTDYQAALVLSQLQDVDAGADSRISYAREYHAALGHLPGIRLPPILEDRSHIYLSFVVQVDDRLHFQRELMARGCDVRLQSYVNLAASETFADFAADCPRAERVATRALLLPIHTGFGLAGIKRVAQVVRSLVH